MPAPFYFGVSILPFRKKKRLSFSDKWAGREALLFLQALQKKVRLSTDSAALFYNGSRIAGGGVASGAVASYSIHNGNFGHFYNGGRVSVFRVGCTVAASCETSSDGCYTSKLEKFFHGGMNDIVKTGCKDISFSVKKFSERKIFIKY